jgi:hypothetical protein
MVAKLKEPEHHSNLDLADYFPDLCFEIQFDTQGDEEFFVFFFLSE